MPQTGARTIQVAVARDDKPTDLVQPGHIFPVRAVPGGVLVRAGHTEVGCHLTAMAGLTPAGGYLRNFKARWHDGAPSRFGRVRP